MPVHKSTTIISKAKDVVFCILYFLFLSGKAFLPIGKLFYSKRQHLFFIPDLYMKRLFIFAK